MDADVQATIKDDEIKINDTINSESNNNKSINLNGIIYLTIKKIIDIIGALIGCIFLVPLTLLIWIANIIVKDNGPVFYVQKRIGQNGKTFLMYKYRSMIVDADRKLKRYLLDNPEASAEFKKYRKLKDDPRITPIGKFIRKTSLDEFPQFINVLKGDMSLVGPRPYLPRERRAMKNDYKEIIKVKPGLTGPWQVNGRSEISMEERIKMDVEYTKECSLLRDIKYLFKTILKIFKSDKGAV